MKKPAPTINHIHHFQIAADDTAVAMLITADETSFCFFFFLSCIA